jgi:hypothetical protein
MGVHLVSPSSHSRGRLDTNPPSGRAWLLALSKPLSGT